MVSEDGKPLGGYSREVDQAREEVLSRVLAEHDIISAQREKHIELLTRLEKYEEGKKLGFSRNCREGIQVSWNEGVPL
jgi:hypothetical protein